jgi:hypothetical protein
VHYIAFLAGSLSWINLIHSQQERAIPRLQGNARAPSAISVMLARQSGRAHVTQGGPDMMSLARAERKAARLVKENLDVNDLYDQLDTLRDYVQELSQSVSRNANRQFGRARDYASEAAHEAEETMRDHLAASLILALGLGLVVGYFLRRSTE